MIIEDKNSIAQREMQVEQMLASLKTASKKKRQKLPFRTYIILLILITVTATSVTFSRYITSVTGWGSVTGSSFQVTYTDEFKNDYEHIDYINHGGVTENYVFMELYPSLKRDFIFTVQNDSDIVIACEAYFETSRQLPLEVTLKRKSAENIGVTDYKAVFDVSHHTTNEFIVTVQWPDTEEAKNYEYSKEIDYIKVVFSCTQKELD